MGLLKKAEEIKAKLTGYLITAEELARAKENRPAPKKTFREKIRINLQPKDPKQYIDSDFSPVKLQQNEVDKLFSTKSVTVGDKIAILDSLLANAKIFLKNLQYQNSMDALHAYLVQTLPAYFYIGGFHIHLFDQAAYSWGLGDETNGIIRDILRDPSRFGSQSIMLISAKNLGYANDRLFFFPIFREDAIRGIFAFEIAGQLPLSENSYYLDFMTVMLNVIPPLLRTVAQKASDVTEVLSFENHIESLQAVDCIWLYTFVNFAGVFNAVTCENSLFFLKEYSALLARQGALRINYKKFYSYERLVGIGDIIESFLGEIGAPLRPVLLEKQISLKRKPGTAESAVDTNETDNPYSIFFTYL